MDSFLIRECGSWTAPVYFVGGGFVDAQRTGRARGDRYKHPIAYRGPMPSKRTDRCSLVAKAAKHTGKAMRDNQFRYKIYVNAARKQQLRRIFFQKKSPTDASVMQQTE